MPSPKEIAASLTPDEALYLRWAARHIPWPFSLAPMPADEWMRVRRAQSRLAFELYAIDASPFWVANDLGRAVAAELEKD